MATVREKTPETPHRIIDAAREAMSESGLLEVSLAEISQRAGTNVALVSYYFGNREGLMVALVEDDAEHAIAELDRLLATDLSPGAKIEAHVGGQIETYFERPYLNRLLEKLLREGSPQASAKVGECFVRPVFKARQAIIAEGVACGEFRQVDAGLMSFIIDGACAHLFSSEQSRRTIFGNGALDRTLLAHYVECVSETILGGLRNR